MEEEASSSSPLTLLLPPSDEQHDSRIFCCDFDSLRLEMLAQLELAAPLVIVNLLQYSLQIVALMFVGRLGEIPLYGASLATSFANVSGFSLLVTGNGKCIGYIMWSGIWCKTISYAWFAYAKSYVGRGTCECPLAIAWSSTSEILILFAQNVEISKEAGVYAQWLIPSLFACGFLQCQVRFLQSQNIVFPMMVTSGVTTLLHILECWVLVFISGLDSKGTAMATSASYWVNVIILAVYIKISRMCKETWTGLSKYSIHGVHYFLPSASMICLEYWSFETAVLLSGFLPNPKLENSVYPSAFEFSRGCFPLLMCFTSIVSTMLTNASFHWGSHWIVVNGSFAMFSSLNTMWMVYTIPSGLGSAASIRVSNELGAGHSAAARISVITVIVITATEGVIDHFGRYVWGYVYSNEKVVASYVSRMMPLLAISDFMDGMQCALSGAARGCGWQKICSIINLAAYYVVGIPSAILFAFVCKLVGRDFGWEYNLCANSSITSATSKDP